MTKKIATNYFSITGLALSISAIFLLFTLIKTAATPANAFNIDATTSDHYTVLTGRSGQGTAKDPYEVVYVIDNYAGTLIIYYVDNAQKPRSIRKVHSEPLSAIFRRAR